MDLLSDENLLLKAVEQLKKIVTSGVEEDKDLFTTDDTESFARVNLVVSLMKIPFIPMNGIVRPYTLKSHIPHCFIGKESDVLLVVKPTVGSFRASERNCEYSLDRYKNKLKKYDALDLVTEVMTLPKITKEYASFESRRRLASQFDVVLCDKCCQASLVAYLGKIFYRKKKRPIIINANRRNIKNEITRALSRTYLHLDLVGSCAMCQIGRMNQTSKDLVENILATIKRWKTGLPGGWINVASVHLKTDSSPSLPLYISELTPRDVPAVTHPITREQDQILAVTPLETVREDAVVGVTTSGKVMIFPSRNQDFIQSEWNASLDRQKWVKRKFQVTGVDSRYGPNTQNPAMKPRPTLDPKEIEDKQIQKALVNKLKCYDDVHGWKMSSRRKEQFKRTVRRYSKKIYGAQQETPTKDRKSDAKIKGTTSKW